MTSPRILSLRQVKERVPLSTATIYRLIQDGTFPRQYKIGPHRVVWKAEEVNAWIDAQLAQSEGAAA